MMFYPSRYFAFYRLCVGLFSLIFFASLIPYGAELFSNEGVFPDPSIFSWVSTAFLLDINDSPAMVSSLLCFGVLLSISFAFGIFRRTSGIILWIIIASLAGRNPYAASFSFEYLSIIFVTTALLPVGESFFIENPSWKMPKIFYISFTLVLAVSYSCSGFTKLFHEAWFNGTAIVNTLQSGRGRDYFLVDLVIGLPVFIHYLLGFLVIFSELLYLPLTLWTRSRPWIWLSMVLIHLGIGLTTHITKMSCAIILFHFLVIPTYWLEFFKFKDAKS